MVIYLILIFMIFCGIGVKNIKVKKWIEYCSVALMIFISAIRVNVGTDFLSYKIMFSYITKNSKDVELGYRYLNVIAKFITDDFQLLIIIESIIIVTFIYLGIKKYMNKEETLWGILLFVLTNHYFQSFNAIRQYIAISICFCFIINFIYKKDLFKFCLTVMFSTLFHKSAILMLPFFWILNNKYDKRLLLFFQLISFCFILIDIKNILFIFDFLIPDKYLVYLNSAFFQDKSNLAKFKLIIPNILLIISILNSKFLYRQNKYNIIIFNFYYISCIIINCFSGVQIMIRMNYYFDIYSILILPLILKIPKNKYLKFLFSNLVIFYYIFYMIITIFVLKGHGALPYKSFLG